METSAALSTGTRTYFMVLTKVGNELKRPKTT